MTTGPDRLQRLGLQLLDADRPADQTQLLLQTLLEVVPGVVAGEIEVDRRTARVAVVEQPEILLSDASRSTIVSGNPGVQHLSSVGEFAAARVTDVIDPASWGSHPLRQGLLEPTGVPFSLMCGYSPRPGVLLGWGINRDRDFSDIECETLAAFFPFLKLAVAGRERTQLLEEMSAALAGGGGVVVVRRGRVVHISREAQRVLDLHRLAPPLVASLMLTLIRGEQSLLVAQTRRGRLRLRATRPAADSSSAVVAVDEPPDPSALARAAGLTNRQHEVLQALAGAATAQESGVASTSALALCTSTLRRSTGVSAQATESTQLPTRANAPCLMTRP